MIKSNYHTHVKYCHHAGGEVEDYVQEALKNNLQEIGISDHAPILENIDKLYGKEYLKFDTNMSYQTIDIYLNDIKKAKEKYQNQIKIFSGFEMEFLSKGRPFYEKIRSKVDFLILGVHYFEFKNKILNSFEDITYQTLDGYVETCIKGMESGLYICLAHPDLFMYNYKNINGERKFDEKAIWATKKIIESAIKNNVYLEVNANGLRDFGAEVEPNKWYYPSIDFWKIAKTYDQLKIIIGADAHNPKALCGKNTNRICQFVKELGLNVSEQIIIKK